MAGEGNRRKGFRAAKKIEAAGQAVDARSVVAAEGRFVLEIVVANAPTVTAETIAKMVDGILAPP